MSDLERSFAKAKLARLPPEPALIFDEEEEDEINQSRPTSASSTDSSSSASSTGTVKPAPGKNLFQRPDLTASRSKTDPLPWQDFFAQELDFSTSWEDDNLSVNYHAYLTPPSPSGPLFVMHHGAGSSGLSFAACTKELVKLVPNAGVLSLDARHHGQTTVRHQGGAEVSGIDLTLATLAKDLAFVVNAATAHLGLPHMPDLVLIGHSLGGAVVTEVVAAALLGASVLGYGVLDVVEGSAMDALQSMDQYLSTRPNSFPSVASGIEWHTRSRTIRNTISARVSVPPLLIQSSPTSMSSKWLWRTDLQATKPFWENWFIGLSKKFLGARGGKLLILAGTDRLDKELMIGQMQGKYQLQVFPEAGHFVQEDQPQKTAAIIADFYRRNDRSTLILPPKVDDLIKQGKIKAAGLPR